MAVSNKLDFFAIFDSLVSVFVVVVFVTQNSNLFAINLMMREEQKK